MLQSLVSLCNLHEMPNFPFIPQLEAAVGAAVKTVGPRYGLSNYCSYCQMMTNCVRVVLGAIPLELENEEYVIYHGCTVSFHGFPCEFD